MTTTTSDITIHLTFDEAVSIEVALDYVYDNDGDCPDTVYEMLRVVQAATTTMMDEDDLWDDEAAKIPNATGELTLDEDEI